MENWKEQFDKEAGRILDELADKAKMETPLGVQTAVKIARIDLRNLTESLLAAGDQEWVEKLIREIEELPSPYAKVWYASAIGFKECKKVILSLLQEYKQGRPNQE